MPSLLWGIHPVSLSIRKRKYKGENPREGPPHVEAELNAQRLTTPTDQVNGVGTVSARGRSAWHWRGTGVSSPWRPIVCVTFPAECPAALYPIKWALSVKDSVGLAYL